jgi:hypothetical protein
VELPGRGDAVPAPVAEPSGADVPVVPAAVLPSDGDALAVPVAALPWPALGSPGDGALAVAAVALGAVAAPLAAGAAAPSWPGTSAPPSVIERGNGAATAGEAPNPGSGVIPPPPPVADALGGPAATPEPRLWTVGRAGVRVAMARHGPSVPQELPAPATTAPTAVSVTAKARSPGRLRTCPPAFPG